MSTPAGNPHRYDDMIGLGHPISKTHPPMARGKRAAQFAAFDALTGFGEAIFEAGRETEEKKELSEDMIDMSLRYIPLQSILLHTLQTIAVSSCTPLTKIQG